jgi:hypothetical protein
MEEKHENMLCEMTFNEAHSLNCRSLQWGTFVDLVVKKFIPGLNTVTLLLYVRTCYQVLDRRTS